jgi:hypothetical protein
VRNLKHICNFDENCIIAKTCNKRIDVTTLKDLEKGRYRYIKCCDKCEPIHQEDIGECEFCKDIKVGLPLIETDLHIEIREIMSKNELVFTNCGDNRGLGSLKINFCPICGRKLE